MFVNPLLSFLYVTILTTTLHGNLHKRFYPTRFVGKSCIYKNNFKNISYLHFQICLFNNPHLSSEYSKRLLRFVICVVVDLLLLLLLSSSSLPSSSSPLCRVFILIFVRKTMSLGNTLLQLFCCYYSWCLYR